MRTLALLLLLSLPTLADDLTRLQIHVTNERGKPVDRASVIVKFGKLFRSYEVLSPGLVPTIRKEYRPWASVVTVNAG